LSVTLDQAAAAELSNLKEDAKNLFWYQWRVCSLPFKKGVKA